jgi:ribosomal protein S27AE
MLKMHKCPSCDEEYQLPKRRVLAEMLQYYRLKSGIKVRGCQSECPHCGKEILIVTRTITPESTISY